MPLYQFLKNLARGGAHLKYGRDVILEHILGSYTASREPIHILDIGCGKCGDLFNIEKALLEKKERVRLHGLDFRPREYYGVDQRVDFRTCNIEEDALPFEDDSMDFIVCNQIYEHCKEIFFLTSEIARVLKKGGKAIIGVPNLSSVHALAHLLVGKQPPPIFVVGPHVRGFCANGLAELFEVAGTFKLLKMSGAGFYPFPAPFAKRMSRLFPSYSVSLMALFEKIGQHGDYLETLRKKDVESSFRGWTFEAEASVKTVCHPIPE